MPPRIPLPRVLFPSYTRPSTNATPLASFFTPFLTSHQPSTTPRSRNLPQQRQASILSSLSDNPGAYNKKIRRGRGPSSGKGKTSGRGHKGQKQHGKVPAGFNGGQTPDWVVHGIRGFDNQFSTELSPLNLDRLQSWITQGRLDTTQPITMVSLARSRCLHGVKPGGVKLLARGAETFSSPINIVVSRASSQAIAAIEAAGGTVTTRYYSQWSVRRVLKGTTHPTTSLLTRDPEKVDVGKAPEEFAYRLPDPAGRKDLEYYRDPAHRGYLSYQVPEGEGPSLFFKTPGTGLQRKKGKGVKGAGKARGAASENRIW